MNSGYIECYNLMSRDLNLDNIEGILKFAIALCRPDVRIFL